MLGEQIAVPSVENINFEIPKLRGEVRKSGSLFSSSSSSSSIFHGVGPLVDPFRSHVSRSLFKGLP
jgi:hypothetical protein